MSETYKAHAVLFYLLGLSFVLIVSIYVQSLVFCFALGLGVSLSINYVLNKYYG